MKTDRNTKAEKSSLVTRTTKRARQGAPKTNGKHPLAGYRHVPVGIVEASLDGKYMDLNEEFCRILGYSRRELLRRGIEDVTHEDDYAIDIKLYEQLIEGKIPFYRLEKRYMRKGGGEIWVELTRTLVCDKKGRPLYTVGMVLDISDRKDVERVLRDSVERLRLATGAAKMFMWEWDFQTQSYTIADNFEQVLGFSGGLLPKNKFDTLWALSPREDIERISEAFEKTVENQDDLHALPCRVINPENGQTVWLEVSAKIIYDHEGKPDRMFGVAQNITESKNIQTEITVISRMPEENPSPVMRLRPEGKVLYANPASAALLEDWMQDGQLAIPQELLKTITQAFTSGRKMDVEMGHEGKFFSFTAAPFLDLGYVNLYGKDMTQRKLAEEKLRESEERFRAIVSQATTGITETDLDGRLLFVNPRFCDMLGYSEVELLGKTIWELTSPEDLEENKRLFQRMLEQGESYQLEKRLIRKDGSPLWTEVSVSEIRDLEGKPQGGVGVVLEIEIRKQAETDLEEYGRQQEALYRLSDRLYRTATVDQVYDAVLDAIHDALQCDRASILLFDHSNVMRFVAWRGLSEAYRKATEGHSPWTPDTKDPQPVVMDDVRTAELSDSLRAVIEAEGIGSLSFMPLVSSGRLIGKFMVYFDTPHIFEERETELSLTIARQLTAGIERGRAEEQLRAKEAELEEIINQTPFMFTRCTRDLRYRFVSRAYAGMIGRTPEDIEGKPLVEIMGEEGFAAILPYVAKVLEGNPVVFEMAVPFRGSVTPFLHVAYTPDRDEQGTVVGWFASILDISERKQTETRLALLAEISDMLRNVDDPYELMYRISEAVGEHLHVKRALFNEIDLEHDREIVHHDYHDGMESVAGVHKVTAYSTITSAEVAAGKTVVNTDSKTDPRTAQDYERTYAKSGERAYVVVPMMRDNRWVASLWASDDVPRQWTREEVSLLETVAERTWAIIEKLRINTALRESEQRFREIFETAGVSVWVEDFSEVKREIEDLRAQGVQDFRTYFGENPDFVRRAIDLVRILDVNNETLELFGANRKQDLIPSLGKLIAHEVEHVFVEELVALAEGRETVRAETQLHTFDGRPISVILTLHFGPPTSDHKRVVVTVTDITEHKEVEEALRASEERMRLATDAAGMFAWEFDIQNQNLTVSDNFAEVLGFPPDLVLINDIEQLQRLIPAEDAQIFQETLVQAFERQQDLRDLQLRIQNPESEQVSWVEVNARTIYDREGKPERMYGVAQNITERKQIEEALARERELLNRLFESIPVMLTIYEPSTNLMGLNRHFEQLIGWSSEQAMGISLMEAIYPDPGYRESVRQFMDRCVENEWMDIQMRTRDGRTLETSWSNIRLSNDMRVGIGIDITERKRAEEALRRNEQMFSTLVSAAPFGVYFIDSQFRLRSVNKGAEAVFSNIHPLIERDFAEVLHIIWPEPFATEAIEQFRHTLRTGESFISPTIIEQRANIDEIQAYDWQIHRITLSDGTFGVVCYFYDLSEQKRMEVALRASESLYRTIARSIPGGGVYVIDKDFRYLVAEGPVTEAFGLTREMLEGHTVSEVYPTEVGQRMIDRLQRNFVGETVGFETAHNGRYYWTQQAPLHDSIGQAIVLTLDITERKQTEEALRQSEERFARFMHHLPGLAWIKDIEGRYVYANAAAESAFNTPRQDLYGKTDDEVFPAEAAAQFRQNDQRALAEGEGVQAIETLRQEDGILHHSLVSKFPIPGPDGSPTLIGGTAFDITERLRAEEALLESEERFRAILRQATAGIVRKDPEGRLIFVNEAFCNMLGRTELELLGQTIWEFMHPDDVAENKRSYERLILEGLPFKLERRFLREDGSVIWIDASVSPMMDAAGKPQSAVAVEVDITGRKLAEEALSQLNLQLEERVLNRTAKLRAVNQTLREEIAERKRAEEAARENEEKLRTLFDLLPVGISFLDLEGKIIQMNPALANIVRLSKEELLEHAYRSRKYIRANGTQMSPAELASQRALTQGKTVYNVETGVILEDGEVVWTSVSAAPVDVADVGAVVVTVDVTESKRAERALQESRERLQILSQRLVEIQEEERRAIARELHDRVGQTLAALNINLIIMNGQISEESRERVGARMSDSMKLVAETIALVRDVMSNLRPAVLDDYGLEAAIESYLTQFASRYEIQTRLEKPDSPLPRLGPSIEMTFLRIAQEALMNIAKHAGASQVKLSLRREENLISMTVEDNGMGMDSWQEANRPGSHGLTIMHERAEAFGGNLRVSSMPGKGTKVEVKIPIETNDPLRARKEMSQ